MARPKPQFSTAIKEISARLKQLRQAVECSQAEMAARLNISMSHYSKLEIGVGCLGPKLIDTICRMFAASRDWLLYGCGPKPLCLSVAEAKLSRPAQDIELPQEKPLLTLARIEEVIEAAKRPDLLELAAKISQATETTETKALALLISQLLLGKKVTGEN